MAELGSENIVEQAERSVKRLPTPVIIIGGLVLAGGAYLLIFRRSPNPAPVTGSPLPVGGGLGLGGGSGVGSPPAATIPGNNASWLQGAISAVAAATGLDLYQTEIYLTQYLSGQTPGGNSSAYSAFQKTVSSALQQFGNPPVPVSVPKPGSFFSSGADWLAAGISELGKVDPALESEIANLLNGQTATLSPAADSLYQQISAIFGTAPGAPAYSIGAAAPAFSVTQTQADNFWTQWTSSTLQAKTTTISPLDAFNLWVSTIQGAIPGASNLTRDQLANSWNILNRSSAQPGSVFAQPGYFLTWLNGIVNNPGNYSGTPTVLSFFNGYTGALTTAPYVP